MHKIYSSQPLIVMLWHNVLNLMNALCFWRICACLEACKYGFEKYYRPLIGLDAFFLKGYIWGGQLMVVIGRYGNNKTFHIAYVVVEAKTRKS